MELQYPYRSSSPAPVTAGPSALRPNSAFGVRRGANGRAAPEHEQEQFAVGDGDESDDDDDAATITGVDAHDVSGDPGSSLQMEPLLRTSSRKREPSANSARVSSGLRDVLFSAASEDASSGDEDGHDQGQHKSSSQGSSSRMPNLVRMTSASQAA